MEGAVLTETAIFPTDPQAAAVELPGGWRLVGASRRGLGHAYDQRGREDDFAVRVVAGVALVALADGIGSRHAAARGAQAAVRGATAISDATLMALASATPVDFAHQALSLFAAAFGSALEEVQHALEVGQQLDASMTPEDLESTLQIWVAVPHPSGTISLAGAQIGDGALYARAANTFGEAPGARWRTVLAQQVGTANNEVTPFNAVTLPWWADSFSCLTELACDCLLAMTDGTADDLRPPYPTPDVPEPDPYLFVDDFGALALRQAQSSQAAVSLLDFLGYRKRQSLDDRTLVMLFREDAP